MEPIWSSEIEPFPCAVTAKHFPDTVQLGDITKLDGARLWPVDIICAGSPCQDLSIAGKREGLDGARSGLFRDAIKLVHDMRRASGGKYPRFFVWENVPGAFSSNKGMDFRAVLEEIGQTEIPMPPGGRWAQAGLVELPTCDIAWRILDAQYWGVPQRRRRIFLVADFGGHCAGQILFERKGVHGDSSQGGEAREGTAAGIESGVGTASVYVPAKARSLTARNDGSPCVDRCPDAVAVYDMTHADEVMRKVPDGRAPTLNARMGTGGNQVPVVSYAMQRSDKFKESQVAHTLAARDYKSPTDLVSTYTAGSFAGYAETKQSGSLKASGGDIGGGSESSICRGDFDATEGNKILRVLREAYGEEKVEDWCFAIVARVQSAKVLRQRVHEESLSGETAQGDKLDDGSLPCAEFVAEWLLRDLREREECGRTSQGRESAEQRDNELDEGVQELSHKTPPSAKEMCDLWRQAQGTRLLREALAAFQEIRQSTNVESWRPIKTVRRLTPLEAERLQGLPDGYTLIDDKTCSDTARYKAIGNGMAQPVANWVIKRIKEVVDGDGILEKGAD